MGDRMKLLLALLGLISAVAGIHDSFIDVKSFKGFQVFRVSPVSEDDRQYVKTLEHRPYYDFWSEVRKDHSVDIMAPPEFVIQLEKVAAKTREAPSSDHAMTWDEYHPLEDMYSFLDYLEATYDFVTTESIGKTHEGRDMRVAKICKGECGSKKAVWIDGGIHAREWISPATVTWMLRELVENNDAHPDLLDSLDWYILPSHNPDGYAFSRESNRLWRKTRSSHGSLFGCKGVDANRNWGFHWNEGGASGNKCDDTYHGPEAFSEVENVNVRDYISARKESFVFYNSIHSYSQLILLPWSYTSELSDNYDYMYDL